MKEPAEGWREFPASGRKLELAAGVQGAVRRLKLPIHDPCHEDWDAMAREGDAQRFCDICTKQVHDLSAMTQSQARTVVERESSKGRVCVRYKADTAGNIRFLPERTTHATSFWRMSLAAASLGLMMLTGCADTQPDEIQGEQCVYEIGPWSFTAQRGQGSCPELEPEPEETFMLGEVAIEPEPEVEPEPKVEPAPEIALGRLVEDPLPPAIEPVHEVQGEIEPIEQAEELIELKGDVAYVPDTQTQPCDPPEDQAKTPPNQLI